MKQSAKLGIAPFMDITPLTMVGAEKMLEAADAAHEKFDKKFDKDCLSAKILCAGPLPENKAP